MLIYFHNAGIILDMGSPATNMVFISLTSKVQMSAPEIEEMLKNRGILVSATDQRRFRLVTHYWIDDSAINKTVESFAEVIS